jgi:hypothetical protein
MDTRDPRIDLQSGDELRGVDGQLRKVTRREGDLLWCQDGTALYRTTPQRWQEWCVQTNMATEPLSHQKEETEQ